LTGASDIEVRPDYSSRGVGTRDRGQSKDNAPAAPGPAAEKDPGRKADSAEGGSGSGQKALTEHHGKRHVDGRVAQGNHPRLGQENSRPSVPVGAAQVCRASAGAKQRLVQRLAPRTGTKARKGRLRHRRARFELEGREQWVMAVRRARDRTSANGEQAPGAKIVDPGRADPLGLKSRPKQPRDRRQLRIRVCAFWGPEPWGRQ